MKFRDLLNEKFYNSFRFSGFMAGVEVFIDPSSKEMRDLMKETGHKDFRIGIEDKPNPKVYIWNSMILHYAMSKNVKFDWGFTWDKKSRNNLRTDGISVDMWRDQVKNKKGIIKKLKKLFPKEDTIMIDYISMSMDELENMEQF